MADRVGEQLSTYRLIRFLGQGGFAEVYLGEEQNKGQQVAVKVVHAQLTTADLERFNAEVATIARLHHPNIVRLLEAGVERGTPFLVMEYAPGGTLRERHPRGMPIPLPLVLEYVRQIAGALNYAHDQKLIHRDIKPENMLLGADGRVLLSDFGIALIAQSSHSQSLKEAAGTAAYMAPEQIQGKPRPASDQYALAVVVYEWLTGELPFQGSLMEMAVQHLTIEPPPLRDKLPSIPEQVERVVLAALSKDPKQRFPSASAFAEALEQASRGELSPLLFATTRITPSSPVLPTTQVVSPGQRPSGATFSSAATERNLSQPGKVPVPAGVAFPQPSRPRTSRVVLSLLATILALLVIGTASAAIYFTQHASSGSQGGPPVTDNSTDNTPGRQGQVPSGTNSPTKRPTPGRTPINTPRPGPTSTPQPGATNTPQPGATNTPQPTATNPPTNTPTPTPTYVTPSLTITPNDLYSNTDCSYTAGNGWSCNVTLTAGTNGNQDVLWHTSAGAGIVFSPPSGRLPPGQSSVLNIFFPASFVCPNRYLLYIGAYTPYATAYWNCVAGNVTISPATLHAPTNCSKSGGSWVCIVTVSSASTNQGGLHWSASVFGVNGVTFSPSTGTLYPGQSVQVTITFSGIVCPASITLYFTSGNYRNNVQWTC